MSSFVILTGSGSGPTLALGNNEVSLGALDF
jgi:hypothetical protein